MRYTIKILLVLLIFEVTGQISSDQYLKIQRAGKVWSDMNFFHPSLERNDAEWEGTYANGIVDVLNSKDTDAYYNSLVAIFDQLPEPKPEVMVGNGSEEYPKKNESIFTSDSMLWVGIRDYGYYADAFKRFEDLPNLIEKSNGVIFDLRTTLEKHINEGHKSLLPIYWDILAGSLTSHAISLPIF